MFLNISFLLHFLYSVLLSLTLLLPLPAPYKRDVTVPEPPFRTTVKDDMPFNVGM